VSSARPLRELAWSCGVQTTFRDTTGRRRSASVDSLLAVLAALGEPVGAPEHAAEALARRRAERAERLLEPVLLAWDGRSDGVEVRLPARAAARIRARLDLEGGEERSWVVQTEDVRTAERAATLRLDGELPFGRHVLTVEAGRRAGLAALLAAPRRATAGRGLRDWGVFVLHRS
jgi:hypothetical protein